ncbi:salicylate hydroxylase [Variovorax sp. YR266]|uniref:FAD-dependent monooxygenase n=1 Tax=Variovorax sp. YR266 TaxID=1884386 RepID=UPI0008946A74|nr:FAD-dependent monooxygenase [Variovorax sp. YR266]SDY34029.1 salicylate hydroxylase [Variovorax sp. YR266]
MNNSQRIQHIVVVGGGLGGLTAALALILQGFQVTVLEQAPALGEVGAGVQLSANATRVLSLLGLDDAISAVGAEAAGKEIRLWSTGQTWKIFDLGEASREQYGHPFCMFHRADLHNALEQGVRKIGPSVIRLNSRCESIDTSGPRPVVVLASGERIEGDVVVGADGVHSRVRLTIAGPDKPQFSGCHAWRGVIPTDRLPKHLRAAVGVNWVGPGRHVVHYPLRRGELTNFVGIVEGKDWQVESWTQQGSMAECLRDFEAWHEDVHTLIRSVDTHFKWALMVREPIMRWSEGRVTLLGDSAHPTLPFLGQGAGMAMEDGYVLARALAAHRDDVGAALAAYEAARAARTARVVRGSNENAARFHNPRLANAAGATQYIEEQWAADKVRQRYEWLFEYKVDEVPV